MSLVGIIFLRRLMMKNTIRAINTAAKAAATPAMIPTLEEFELFSLTPMFPPPMIAEFVKNLESEKGSEGEKVSDFVN